ncbi:MAG: hypothetical protein QOJ75_648 [Chloroflexota bacterium]|nr:hypothetical protein [Chloroflexota bacterium]
MNAVTRSVVVASQPRSGPRGLDKLRRPVTREYERLIRIWHVAELRRDLIAIIVIQSRVGRLTYAFLETVARG